MAETISVEKSFELPTDKDWEYLGNEFINNIRIMAKNSCNYKPEVIKYTRMDYYIHTKKLLRRMFVWVNLQ